MGRQKTKLQIWTKSPDWMNLPTGRNHCELITVHGKRLVLIKVHSNINASRMACSRHRIWLPQPTWINFRITMSATSYSLIAFCASCHGRIAKSVDLVSFNWKSPLGYYRPAKTILSIENLSTEILFTASTQSLGWLGLHSPISRNFTIRITLITNFIIRQFL